MKLILLYGPPAVGKLTVAKELSKLTGITIYHSHMILNDIVEIFGYDNPARREIEFEFKQRVIEEAVKQDKDLIITASPNVNNIEYYDKIINSIEDKATTIIVRLTAEKDVLLSRVQHASRKNKINDVELFNSRADQYPESFGKFFNKEQLTIDTAETSPLVAAMRIKEEYNL